MRKDETGKKYNHITLLRYSRPSAKGVGSRWLGRCDCGNVREYLVRDVRHGRVKTCGTCELHRNLISRRKTPKPGPRYQLRRRMAREIRRAVIEGQAFDLGDKEFRALTAGTCTFCPETKGLGVQRIRPDEAYTSRNCMPICLDCRRTMLGMTAEECVLRWSKMLSSLGLLVIPANGTPITQK
jgi:hypothetical protein